MLKCRDILNSYLAIGHVIDVIEGIDDQKIMKLSKCLKLLYFDFMLTLKYKLIRG